MTTPSHHSSLWRLVADQHYVVTRAQLLEAGISPAGIRHRVKAGRLHPKGRGIYAVGRPVLSQSGEFAVAVLACGPGGALSHESAGLHLDI
jgi:hypothetical protein